MKRIFIFPTIEEAKAFILTQPRDPVFVAGVGAAEIAAATIRAVKARKPQLVVLAGIAGAYDRSLQRGEVVEVVSERIAGIPERYAREYETSGPDLGLPLAAGVTVNRSGDSLRETGRKQEQEQEQEFRETGYGIPEPETKSGDAVSAPAGQTLPPTGERADSPEQPSDMQSAIGDTDGTDGQLWERTTALPLPLGGIAAKRSLPEAVRRQVETLIRQSIEYAFAHPEASRAYIKEHAQELDDAVIDAHIALFVNDYSLSLGDEGRRAVEALTGIACAFNS